MERFDVKEAARQMLYAPFWPELGGDAATVTHAGLMDAGVPQEKALELMWIAGLLERNEFARPEGFTDQQVTDVWREASAVKTRKRTRKKGKS